MIAGGTGGAITTANGNVFEVSTSFSDMLSHAGYEVHEDGTYWRDDRQIDVLAPKHQLKKRVLTPNGVKMDEILSKGLLPDEALFISRANGYVLRIFEKKCQHSEGSVDEKLQCGAFKLSEYEKLAAVLSKTLGASVKAEFHFLLSDWFKSPKYADVIEFNRSYGIQSFFGTIPSSMFE